MAIQTWSQTTIWGWIVQQVLDPTDELLALAHQIDWEAITDALRPYYHRLGRWAKPLRLMVGLHLLKHRLHLSDARVVQGLHEHLYWMTVCGIDVGAVREQAPPGTPIRFLYVDHDRVAAALGAARAARLGNGAPAAVGPREDARWALHEHGYDGAGKARRLPHRYRPAGKGRRQRRTLIGDAQAAGVVFAQGLRRCRRTAKRVVLAATKLGTDQLERIERPTASCPRWPSMSCSGCHGSWPSSTASWALQRQESREMLGIRPHQALPRLPCRDTSA